jgi:hypothetical protein
VSNYHEDVATRASDLSVGTLDRGAMIARASQAVRAMSAGVLIVATLLAGLPALLFTPLNHDVACGLYYSRRMLAGDQLYRDIVENNPPLIYYLGMPVEWLAQHAGLLETQVLAGVFVGLTLAIVALSARLLRLDPQQSPAVRWSLLLACVAVALLLPTRDFGQREHFAYLLLIPYGLLCVMRAEQLAVVGRGMILTIAGAAAIGLAVKPQMAFAWLAMIAYVPIRRRDWRAALTLENIAIAGALGAYVAFVLLWTPDYMRVMVPIAAKHYGAYTVSPWLLMSDPVVRLLVIGLLLLAGLASFLTGSREAARLVRPLALIGLVLFVGFLLQATPFRYHLLPAMAFYLIALATAIAAFVRSLFGSRERAVARLALRTIMLTVSAIPSVWMTMGVIEVQRIDVANARAGVTPLVGPLVEVVHAAAAGEPIYVLSSSVNPAFPLVNLTDTRWPYHYNCLWLLPTYYRDDENYGLARYHMPAEQTASEQAFFQAIVTDLQRTPPTVLIVDRSRFKQGFGVIAFDFVDYFSQSPAFATFFHDYGLIARVGPYEVFKRGIPKGALNSKRN